MIEYLPRYRRHLAERYSTHTARDYAAKVKQFHAWLGERPLTEGELRAYREHLRQRTARATVRGCLAALTTWFCFLQRAGVATNLPVVPPPLDVHENRQGQSS